MTNEHHPLSSTICYPSFYYIGWIIATTSQKRRSNRRPTPPQEGRTRYPHVLKDSLVGSTLAYPLNYYSRSRVNLEKIVKELEAKLREICMGDCHRNSSHDFSTQSPFFDEILNEPVPHQFKMPSINPYDGSTDPVDHLKGYKVIM